MPVIIGIPMSLRVLSPGCPWGEGVYVFQQEKPQVTRRYCSPTASLECNEAGNMWTLSRWEDASVFVYSDTAPNPIAPHKAKWPGGGITISPITEKRPPGCPLDIAEACRWATEKPAERTIPVCAALWERISPRGYSVLLKALRGERDIALKVFTSILKPNEFHFSATITACGDLRIAKVLLAQAQSRGLADAGVFNALTVLQRRSGDKEGMRATQQQMDQAGVEATSHVFSSLLRAAESADAARRIMQEADQKGKATLSVRTAYEASLRRHGDTEGAQEMRKFFETVEPNPYIVSSRLVASLDLQEAEHVYNEALKYGVATPAVQKAFEAAQRRFGDFKGASRTKGQLIITKHKHTKEQRRASEGEEEEVAQQVQRAAAVAEVYRIQSEMYDQQQLSPMLEPEGASTAGPELTPDEQRESSSSGGEEEASPPMPPRREAPTTMRVTVHQPYASSEASSDESLGFADMWQEVSDNVLCYAVDRQGIILEVLTPPSWDGFLQSNKGTGKDLECGKIEGSSMQKHLCPFYRRVLHLLTELVWQDPSRRVSYTYFCDGPEMRRCMMMTLRRRGDTMVWTSSLVYRYPHDAPFLAKVRGVASGTQQCGWCQCLVSKRGTWVTPTEYAKELGHTDEIEVCYGACVGCLKAFALIPAMLEAVTASELRAELFFSLRPQERQWPIVVIVCKDAVQLSHIQSLVWQCHWRVQACLSYDMVPVFSRLSTSSSLVHAAIVDSIAGVRLASVIRHGLVLIGTAQEDNESLRAQFFDVGVAHVLPLFPSRASIRRVLGPVSVIDGVTTKTKRRRRGTGKVPAVLGQVHVVQA
eukprot:Hpha_TRINITY_DN14863_c0_g2::TRINITY_DN14863_c0_g2_i1::g.169993::m.169993